MIGMLFRRESERDSPAALAASSSVTRKASNNGDVMVAQAW
jgi:hypothetical protein